VRERERLFPVFCHSIVPFFMINTIYEEDVMACFSAALSCLGN
jgi:hypothetical protein